MNKLAAALLFLLLSTNAYWVYATIDHAITDDYKQVSADETSTALSQLISISSPLFRGKSADDIRGLANGRIAEEDIFAKSAETGFSGDRLVVGRLIFPLDSAGRVEGVSDRAE